MTRSFFRILITDKARTVPKNLSSYADHELSIVNKIKAPELTYIVIFTMIPWSIFINNLFFYTNILHIENGDKHGVPARLSKDYFYNIHWQVFYIIFHNYQISFNRSWKFVAVNWNQKTKCYKTSNIMLCPYLISTKFSSHLFKYLITMKYNMSFH